jgi:phospholipid/cholesterol/gamma-HCH transport system substrate-binding protein
MSAPSNHWKLGLFVVVGVALFLALLVGLGAASLKKESVAYATYFDESVQGLDVGSPVKFRGVTIGNVSEIDVAPDRRHVEVLCAITVSQLVSLKLLDTSHKKELLPFGRKRPVTLAVPADLRMQLESAGITGVKFISIDFFDIKDNPPPVLPFPVPDNYVPAAPSTLKSLEDAVVKAVNRFPEIADQLVLVTTQVNHLLASIDDEKIPQQAGLTLSRASDLLAALQVTVKQADVGGLSTEARHTIGGLNGAIAHLDGILTKMGGDKGILVSAQRATDSIGDLAGGAKSIGTELGDTLRDVREAADSIQRLADALDTDSDMLLKGRAKGRP